jgi:hypothetical protein
MLIIALFLFWQFQISDQVSLKPKSQPHHASRWEVCLSRLTDSVMISPTREEKSILGH